METNDKLFGDFTNSYKAERQREKMKELEREELWKKTWKAEAKDGSREIGQRIQHARNSQLKYK